MISLMVPAPTVRPPSRMAKRRPFSMATGVCSRTSNSTLSPGITISVPAGSLAEPVTSVVPGDNVELEVLLHTPVAMEKGLRFAIREGGRTVGAGTISEIIA